MAEHKIQCRLARQEFSPLLYRIALVFLVWNGVANQTIAAPRTITPSSSVEKRAPSLVGKVHITFKSGRLTLTSVRAPLHQVLDAFAETTGVRLHYGPVPRRLVTVSCEKMTVTAALECLLGRGTSTLLRHRFKDVGASSGPSNGRGQERPPPMDAWLLGLSEIGVQDGSAITGAHGSDTKALSFSAKRQQRLRAHLKLAYSGDTEARMQGLSGLALYAKGNEPVIREVLNNALSDPNEDVRAQAVYALARLDGAASAATLQQALHDRDASVRLMVVDSAEAKTWGVPLLHQALTDEDETVRALATVKLEIGGYAAITPDLN